MGLNGAFLTGDAFNLFVFFEVLLIASYGLMVHGGTGPRRAPACNMSPSTWSARRCSCSRWPLLYSVTGTLNMADLAESCRSAEGRPRADARGRGAADAGLCGQGRAGAAALLAARHLCRSARSGGRLFAVMTKVGAYAALRFGTLVFPPDGRAPTGLIGPLLCPPRW
jgi:multicomponent K+:H+ antiporter subunit D